VTEWLKIEDVMINSTTRSQPPFGVETNARDAVRIKEAVMKRTIE
jgi:hypothetical protein